MRGFRIGYARAVRISGDGTTYSVSGQAAGTNYGRQVAAAQGAYTQTGQAATLTVGGTGSGPAVDDWTTRISGSSVVWYHNFDSAAEVNQFRWTSGYNGGGDPLAQGDGATLVSWQSSGGADGGAFMRLTYPLGNVNGAGNSYWWRPFNPLTGATNGRGTNDPGANGTIATTAFNITDGSSLLNEWTTVAANPGWYGSPTDQAANPSEYQGTDFYLQVRVRRAQTPGAPPDNAQFQNITGKNVWLTTTLGSYTVQEIVTYGQSAGEDSVGVQGRHRMYGGFNFNPFGGSQDNESVTISNIDGISDWRWSGGWDTLLYHITPGTNGGTGANRSRIEVWAQHDSSLFPLETGQYTKIWDTVYTAHYDTGFNSQGAPASNGWNALILAIYHNGAVFTTSQFHFDYDQVIFSKATIPAPGALPSWVSALSANQWYEIPSSAMAESEPSPIPPGATGPESKIIAWTSFAVDSAAARVYSAANGGHNDYGGNEVDLFSALTENPGWTALTTPSTASPVNQDYYGDGKPNSTHTYHGQQFCPISKRVYNLGGARYSDGNGTRRMASFNTLTSTWNASSTHPDIPDAGGSGEGFAYAVDSRNGNMYAFANFAVNKFDRAANTWTQVLSASINCDETPGTWDSTRNRAFVVGGLYQSAFTYTPDTNTLTQRTLTGAAATTILNSVGAALTYVPAIDKFLMRLEGSGGTVYTIDANTFACSTLSTTGGAGVPATQNGPYHKFLFTSALRGCLYFPTYSGNAWFLRLY